MTYTQLAIVGVVLAVLIDMFILRTRLLGRRSFWVPYAIIVFFQLLTNGLLTGFRIVRYSGESIIGSSTPEDGPPAVLGDGRIGFAPVEDKYHVHDLQATILHLLGFDHERLTYRFQGRDFRLTDVHGHVVKDILA